MRVRARPCAGKMRRVVLCVFVTHPHIAGPAWPRPADSSMQNACMHTGTCTHALNANTHACTHMLRASKHTERTRALHTSHIPYCTLRTRKQASSTFPVSLNTHAHKPALTRACTQAGEAFPITILFKPRTSILTQCARFLEETEGEGTVLKGRLPIMGSACPCVTFAAAAAAAGGGGRVECVVMVQYGACVRVMCECACEHLHVCVATVHCTAILDPDSSRFPRAPAYLVCTSKG